MRYRLYVLTNYYLSSIQKGIQTAHVVSELFAWYTRGITAHSDILGDGKKQMQMLLDWAEEDKTIIVLNGGNSQALLDFRQDIPSQHYPAIAFSEDNASLGGATTALGILLPETVYAPRSIRRMNKKDRIIYQLIKQLPLAI